MAGQHAMIHAVVVGCGIRGRLFATSLSQALGVTVAAVVDADAMRAKELARDVGAVSYATVGEMLQRHPEIDVAIIATPDFAHVHPAVECAQRGLHLVVEKPLATDAASARRILDAAAASEVRVMVAFENRWNARFSEARRLIDEGAVGRVTNIVAQLNDTIHVPTQMLPWAAKSSPAWFLMPHTLDLALWYTGATPVDVYARGTRGVLDARGIETWDAVSALVGLSDGSTVTLHSSWVLPESTPAVFDFRIDVQGSDGAMALDGAHHGMTLYGPGRLSWPQLGVHWRHGEIRGYPVDMVRELVCSIRDDRPEVPTGEDGLIVTATIEAIHRSLATHESVMVETLPQDT